MFWGYIINSWFIFGTVYLGKEQCFSNALFSFCFLALCVNNAFICIVFEQFFLYNKCACYHIFDDT